MEILLSALLGGLASRLQGETKLKRGYNLLIAFVACVLAGLITALAEMFKYEETFEWERLLGYIGISFTASQTFYNIHFKELK
jgi:hypothetical protein